MSIKHIRIHNNEIGAKMKSHDGYSPIPEIDKELKKLNSGNAVEIISINTTGMVYDHDGSSEIVVDIFYRE